MNVMQAAFNVVHDYPGGAVALGQAIGKNGQVLSHEVNPNIPTAKFGLSDAVRISMLTGDRRMLNAFGAEMNCIVIPLPPMAVGSESVVARTASLASEFGQLMAEVSTDVGDGVISDNERARIEGGAGELVAALQQLLSSIKAMNARCAVQAAA